MKIFHRFPSCENISQTEVVIEAIRRFPGIKRSDLIDLRVNNNRIGCNRHTTYEIVPIIEEK